MLLNIRRTSLSLILIIVAAAAVLAGNTGIRNNRLTLGYNMEFSHLIGQKLNVGNGFTMAYTHSFGIGMANRLAIDFGPRLTYSCTTNVHYYTSFEGFETHRYVNYSLRLPVSTTYRLSIKNITMAPYAGVQTGAMLHWQPNEHDGKCYLYIPFGVQAGCGLMYKRWYYGIDCSISTFGTNLSFSAGITF